MKNLSSSTLTTFLAVAALSIAGCSGSGGDGGDSGNSAPTISGDPPSAVLVGSGYSFRPSASDPNGDALTFVVQNKPSWATFNTKTGEISGIPTTGNIGMFSNISITVSDGEMSASTPQFAVEVTQVQLGSVTLSWVAPTDNSDGSTLIDLDAYKIYYGDSPENYANQLRIENPSITTYVVDNLVPDTYFFMATSVNSQGLESPYSNTTQVTID